MYKTNIFYNTIQKATKRLLVVFCFSFAVLLTTPLHANTQDNDNVVSGTIYNNKGETIPGANVYFKGTAIGAVTDTNGKFNITIPKGATSIIVTFVGFKNHEHRLSGDNRDLGITLTEQNEKIDEVVTIGYQSVQRRTTTAAMTTVSAEEIENVPYPSVDQILAGKVAGLVSLSTSGEPGANTIVNIRGSNSVSLGGVSYPLYVIDGMIYDINDMPSAYGNNPLTAINPNDIESIDILKDASAAAIYGSRGANGVILVKTKTGSMNQVPEVRINAYAGVGTKPTLRSVITGQKERQLKLDLLADNGYLYVPEMSNFLTDSLNPSFNNNLDWQDIFAQNSLLYNVDASVSGAFGENQYRISMGYYSEEGVMIGYGLRRMSPKLYLSLNPKEWMNITVNFAPSFIDIKHGYGNGSTFPFSSWDFPSSFWNLSEDEVQTYKGQVDNMDRDKTTNMITNAKLNLTLHKDLMFTTSFSHTYRNNRRDFLYSKLINGTDQDQAQNWGNETIVWEIENYLTYMKTLKEKHNLSVILGQQASMQTNASSYSYGYGVLGNTIYGLSPGTDLYSQTYFEEKTRVGIFGRVSYDYDKKYMFSSSYRRDASSRYHPSKRWADFYSVSAGWMISEENFFQPLRSVVNDLKFRASYGVTGSDPASYYAQYNLYTSNASYYGSSFGENNTATSMAYNGQAVITQDYERAADKFVTWEKYPQVNLGIDLGLFNNHLNIQADWYARDSENLFYNDMASSVTSGYNYYTGNAVSIRNTGYEFTVNAKLLTKGKFKWNADIVLGVNENYVTELPNGGKDLTVGASWMQYTLTVGKPLFAYRVWETNGIYATNDAVPTDPLTGNKITFYGTVIKEGDPIYVDQNGDYNIDLNDKIYAGDPNASVSGGITNTFFYKNWSLSVLCNFVTGREVWNGYASDMMNGSKAGSIAERWGYIAGPGVMGDFNYYTGPSDADAEHGSIFNNDLDRFHIANSKYIEDGSFFRVKNVTVGYQVPKEFTQRLKLNSLRLYGMVDNLFLWTNSTLPDPEAVGANGYSTGNTYPLAMKFTFGLTAGF